MGSRLLFSPNNPKAAIATETIKSSSEANNRSLSWGHHEIVCGKQFCLLFCNPVFGIGMAALRAGPVVAGMPGEMLAVTTTTAEDLPAQSGRTTTA